MRNQLEDPIDQVRDELFSHIQRCRVLVAETADQSEWLKDTMDFLADRYPDLSAGQLATVEMMGRRYLEPAVPHGASANATNRDMWPSEANPQEDPEDMEDAAALTASV